MLKCSKFEDRAHVSRMSINSSLKLHFAQRSVGAPSISHHKMKTMKNEKDDNRKKEVQQERDKLRRWAFVGEIR